MDNFETRLKILRTETKKTQQELAESLSISKQTISNYESGTREPKIEVLMKISSYFNVTVDYLIGKSIYKNHIQKSLSGILADILEVPSESISDGMDLFNNYFELIKLSIHPYLSTGANLEELTENLKDCMESLLDCSIHSLRQTNYAHAINRIMLKGGNFESAPIYPIMNKELHIIDFNMHWKIFIDNLQIRCEKMLEAEEQTDPNSKFIWENSSINLRYT